jgi:hypothetical protein
MTQSPGRWIPPQGLIFGQLAHGASWVLLLVLAVRGSAGTGLPALGWVHLVALGWLTMTALSILVHVIPAFTDAVWRRESLARRSLAVYAIGVLLLVGAFCTSALRVLPWGGTLVALGLIGYTVPAGVTLAPALRVGRAEAAVARALATTLGFLLLAAGLGVAFTWALNGGLPVSLLTVGPPIHAEVGMIGWLTVLAMGVSARTVGPITGGRSRQPWRHVTAGFSQVLGVLVVGVGFALHSPAVIWIGTALLGIGVTLYVTDLVGVTWRATVRHRPPQAFLAAAAVWLVAAFILGVGVLAGERWGPALIYVLFIGWLGQIVNANLHHIGIRLLATAFRGDDDETGPGELLSRPLSWMTFVFFQAAVILGAFALLADSSALLASAAVAGLLGWAAMVANVLHAARRASRPPTVISLLPIR